MTAIDVIDRFLSEQQAAQDKINQLFAQTAFTSPILKREYYLLAERICNEIRGFEDIAEAMLTNESPRKIDPQVFLRIWILISEALLGLNGSFDADLSSQLKTLFQSLCLQNADQRFTSPQWITNCIKNLKSGESFQLLLPHTTPSGKSLENLVVYKKNNDETFDIQFFNARKESWDQQGGEHAIGHEKILPFRFYDKVPVQDLLGPNFNGDSAIHAKILSRATGEPDAQGLMAAFAPLTAFLAQPEQQSRLIGVEHVHGLKGMHAFLYATLWEITDEDQALEKYKALLCICRLVLSIAVMKSVGENEGEKLHSKLGSAG